MSSPAKVFKKVRFIIGVVAKPLSSIHFLRSFFLSAFTTFFFGIVGEFPVDEVDVVVELLIVPFECLPFLPATIP